MATRDANQGAGLESGCTKREKITDGLSGLGKPKPENVGGAWPKAKVLPMSNGHEFKNG